jgi:hypothetical protein
MTRNNENYSSAKHSTAHVTSDHETVARYIAVIGETYPELHNLHYRIRKRGRRITIRAKYGSRSLFSHGTDFTRAMHRFTRQCFQKVANRYYLEGVLS